MSRIQTFKYAIPHGFSFLQGRPNCSQMGSGFGCAKLFLEHLYIHTTVFFLEIFVITFNTALSKLITMSLGGLHRGSEMHK